MVKYARVITQEEEFFRIVTDADTLRILSATEIQELLEEEDDDCRPLPRTCAGKRRVDFSNINIDNLRKETKPFCESFVSPHTEVKIIEKIPAEKLCDGFIIVILEINPDKPLSPYNRTLCFFSYNGRILTLDEFVDILKKPNNYSDELFLKLQETCRELCDRELCDSHYDERFNYIPTNHVWDTKNEKIGHARATKDTETESDWNLSVHTKIPYGESQLQCFQTC